MTHKAMSGKAKRVVASTRGVRAPRLVAKFWGTTKVSDRLVALKYLADSRRLVRGPAILEYEEAFARQIGTKFAYSFSSGRLALHLVQPGGKSRVSREVHVRFCEQCAARRTKSSGLKWPPR